MSPVLALGVHSSLLNLLISQVTASKPANFCQLYSVHQISIKFPVLVRCLLPFYAKIPHFVLKSGSFFVLFFQVIQHFPKKIEVPEFDRTKLDPLGQGSGLGFSEVWGALKVMVRRSGRFS